MLEPATLAKVRERAILISVLLGHRVYVVVSKVVLQKIWSVV